MALRSVCFALGPAPEVGTGPDCGLEVAGGRTWVRALGCFLNRFGEGEIQKAQHIHDRAEGTSPRRVSGTYYSSPGKAGISGLHSRLPRGVRDTVEMGVASRDSTGFVLMEEGLISGPAESRGAPPPPQDPSPLRGTLGSSLRSPVLLKPGLENFKHYLTSM